MHGRGIVGGVLAVMLAGTISVAACRSHKPGPLPQTNQATTATTQAVTTSDHDGGSPVPPATASSADRLAAAVSAARACTAPTSTIVNTPDGGLVFVNAWRRQDAGNIDRLQGVVDTLVAQSHAFRCCFDTWQRTAANSAVLLEMELQPDGSVKSASLGGDDHGLAGTVTEACLLDVAKSLDYPPSPSGVSTLVEFPFVVSPP